MLTVEQVRNLDNKVKSALDLIDKLRKENSMLKSKLGEYHKRVAQLEDVVDGFKLEQLEIEEGIKDVLSQLDQIEDQITSPETISENVDVITVKSEDNSTEKEVIEPAETEKTDNRVASDTPELEIF